MSWRSFSRALDTIWSTAAFDPRKPVDPDWAKKRPSPVLRSGDEYRVLSDLPEEHHQGSDAMDWNQESSGGQDLFNLFGDEEENEDGSEPSEQYLSDHDLTAIRNHRNGIRDWGTLEGNDPKSQVQYYNDSNLAHYYTYNPHGDAEKPWVLNTSHWKLREPLTSRHRTFEHAAVQSNVDRELLKRHGVD